VSALSLIDIHAANQNDKIHLFKHNNSNNNNAAADDSVANELALLRTHVDTLHAHQQKKMLLQRKFLCIYVCMYVCMYVFIYVCMYVCVHVARLYVCQ
jgi:hypothetical protein